MNTKHDLSTTEGVLEWASTAVPSITASPETTLALVQSMSPADTETAAYIAECVPLRRAFDALRRARLNAADPSYFIRLSNAMRGTK